MPFQLDQVLRKHSSAAAAHSFSYLRAWSERDKQIYANEAFSYERLCWWCGSGAAPKQPEEIHPFSSTKPNSLCERTHLHTQYTHFCIYTNISFSRARSRIGITHTRRNKLRPLAHNSSSRPASRLICLV
jgi:hypothetical protein